MTTNRNDYVKSFISTAINQIFDSFTSPPLLPLPQAQETDESNPLTQYALKNKKATKSWYAHQLGNALISLLHADTTGPFVMPLPLPNGQDGARQSTYSHKQISDGAFVNCMYGFVYGLLVNRSINQDPTHDEKLQKIYSLVVEKIISYAYDKDKTTKQNPKGMLTADNTFIPFDKIKPEDTGELVYTL